MTLKLIMLTILVPAILYIVSSLSNGSPTIESDPPVVSKWQLALDHLKKLQIIKRFQNSVAQASLKTLEKSIENTIEQSKRDSENLKPLIMLVVSAPNNRNSNCLLQEIKGIFEKALEGRAPIEIDGSKSTPEDIHHLQDQFEKDSLDFAIINSVTEMDFRAFQKIHIYANDEDSLKKKLVLILTAHSELVDDLKPGASLKELEEVVSRLLQDAYGSSIHHDGLEKMVSRITEKPIVLLSTGSKKSVCD